MKAIIQCYTPEEIERIARGEQTVKVCKTAPKDTPFKVYMYCTKDGMDVYGNAKRYVTDTLHILNENAAKAFEETTGLSKWNGKVVSYYVCERVTKHEICDSGAVINYWAEGLQHSCLTISQIDEYVGKRSSADYYKKSEISALHIPTVKFYDEPKELSEFSRYGYKKIEHKGSGYVFCDNTQCRYCEPDEVIAGVYRPPVCRKGGCKITRPPQSWQYVEEVDYDR